MVKDGERAQVDGGVGYPPKCACYHGRLIRIPEYGHLTSDHVSYLLAETHICVRFYTTSVLFTDFSQHSSRTRGPPLTPISHVMKHNGGWKGILCFSEQKCSNPASLILLSQ